MTMTCVVTRKEAGVVTLASSPAKVGGAGLATPSVHNMVPGVRISGKVEQIL